MPSTLSAQKIVSNSFDEANAALRTTSVAGPATPYTTPADYSIQSILARVYDDATATIRTVNV